MWGLFLVSAAAALISEGLPSHASDPTDHSEEKSQATRVIAQQEWPLVLSNSRRSERSSIIFTMVAQESAQLGRRESSSADQRDDAPSLECGWRQEIFLQWQLCASSISGMTMCSEATTEPLQLIATGVTAPATKPGGTAAYCALSDPAVMASADSLIAQARSMGDVKRGSMFVRDLAPIFSAAGLKVRRLEPVSIGPSAPR